MPSKLRKAIGAVKDQTSLSLAKVTNNHALEVAVLKATSHDDVPIDDRYVMEVLCLISSNKAYAAACAHAVAKRIGKTRNWIVAVKSLMLVLRIFQDGDPYFPIEVLHAMKRGAKILNLSGFRDDSNSSPWDYTAFVRTFAVYLHERLDCFFSGKLQQRFTDRPDRMMSRPGRVTRRHKSSEPVKEMKPAVLLDKIMFWQRLLDRAIATRPTGAAKTNRLIQICLYAVVMESFDLYHDISDGLALLLDSFFHLPYQSCVHAFQTCVKASKQFQQLAEFYTFCKGIGIGRTSEYPSVQKMSEELLDTLQEFLKDQSSFPAGNASPAPKLLLPAPSKSRGDKETDHGMSKSTSLDDIASYSTDADPAASPAFSFEPECYSDLDRNDDSSSCSVAADLSNSVLDLVSFDDDWTQPEGQKQDHLDQNGWELVLFNGSATSENQSLDFFSQMPDQYLNNPFLSELASSTPVTPQDMCSSPFLASPGFGTLHNQNDPFGDFGHSPTTFQSNQHDPFAAAETSPPTFRAIPNGTMLHSQNDPTTPNGTILHYQNDPFAFTASPTNHGHINELHDQNHDPLTSMFASPTFVAQNPNDAKLPLQSENDPFASNTVPHRHSVSTWDLNQPTFRAIPTFSASEPSSATGLQNGDDPFADIVATNEGDMSREQQLWIQNQNKIIAKHMN